MVYVQSSNSECRDKGLCVEDRSTRVMCTARGAAHIVGTRFGCCGFSFPPELCIEVALVNGRVTLWAWAGTGEKTKKMPNTATCPVKEKKCIQTQPNKTLKPQELCVLYYRLGFGSNVCSRSGRVLPTGSMEWDFLQLGYQCHLCWLGSSHCELEKWRNYQSGFSGEGFSKQSNPDLWSFQAWTAAFAPGWTWGVLPAGISLALRAFELRQR